MPADKSVVSFWAYVRNREVSCLSNCGIITKVYEEIIRGSVEELIEKLEAKPIKGEIVLLIKSKEDYEEEEDTEERE